MNLKPRRIEDPEINVMSLIDVVLLLVVFFMLSSNFTAEGRLRIRLPQASQQPTEQRAGRRRWWSRSAPPARIWSMAASSSIRAPIRCARRSSRRRRQPRAAAPVTIRADGRATHQAVVTAMDVLGRLGFTQMNVATVNENRSGRPLERSAPGDGKPARSTLRGAQPCTRGCCATRGPTCGMYLLGVLGMVHVRRHRPADDQLYQDLPAEFAGTRAATGRS